ncbi:hypothetical protein AVEN_143005-1 [Araneus ventricosus]|uniref:Uncharacterized protein n=1 Tax=Araneus ventricosus TaxID=182803 RepID=A0A4Y2P931_ARAVE|nr:hypothetical protein AVEN_261400-1 [Araneus ventricosus]GBN47793.1 hypothetical protein AVEN_254193-1 [Araneus ventricosus]GBN47801.1 hypothetical protein AVEN_272752-1 [Araneus ventricosus]GBN48784.1 hypothetical protein AVEN_143005-1 [Araneus ventricosus]
MRETSYYNLGRAVNETFLKQVIHRSSKMKFLEHGKEKPIVKVKNQIIRNCGIQKNLKSNTQSADSTLRPRCEGSGKTEDLPTLAPRVEARNETRNPPAWGKRNLCGSNSVSFNLVSKQTVEHP